MATHVVMEKTEKKAVAHFNNEKLKVDRCGEESITAKFSNIY